MFLFLIFIKLEFTSNYRIFKEKKTLINFDLER